MKTNVMAFVQEVLTNIKLVTHGVTLPWTLAWG